MNSYTKTKHFTEWLKQVRPDFEIKNINHIQKEGYIIHNISDRGEPMTLPYPAYIPLVSTDTLHSILWELFDVELVKETYYDPFGNFGAGEYRTLTNEKYTAGGLWQIYTAGKESMWLTNPDSCLDDIMKVYNQMNR